MSPRRAWPRAGVRTQLPVVWKRSASTLNPDAAGWIARVVANGGTVSSATASAVNTFCNAIDAAGIRDRFFRMGIFAGSNLNAALVPLYRGPSLGGTQYGGTTDTNNAFVGVGTDYTETGASGGLTGNGTTKYLNTGFAHNTLPQNDSHAAVYEISRSSATFRTSLGARTTSLTGFFIMGTWVSTANYSFNAFESNARLDVASSAGGFYVGSVNGAADTALYRNGGGKATSTITTRTPGPQNLFVFALNDGGAPTVYTDARLAGYSVGLKMTDAQVASYNTAMQAFQTALGRNV